jgi:hypothetical protein
MPSEEISVLAALVAAVPVFEVVVGVVVDGVEEMLELMGVSDRESLADISAWQLRT